jgi:murein DD-endopeptidase MepM/ murein hydrolase activator NlpD
MMQLLLYLLKVSAVMTVFFGLYYLTMRHYTFHPANRICLMTIIVLSFIVPLLPVNPVLNGPAAIIEQVGAEYGLQNETIGPGADTRISARTNFVFPLAIVVYLTGLVFFLYRFVKSLVILYRLVRKSPVEERKGFRIRCTEAASSFTFLNTIFVPHGETDEMILHHEQAHVTQLHWIDLMLAELVSVILWFNPVVFFLKRELRLQHEYLADRSVLDRGIRFERYAQCLIGNVHTLRIPLNPVSPLHSNSTKKRILMMTRRESSRYLFFTYLLMIPAFAAVLMSFGRKNMGTESGADYSVQLQTFNHSPELAPVDLTKVTRIVMYGDRIHPATQKLTRHTGIDFELPSGSDVVATADGTVAVQKYGEREGNYIIIGHDDTYTTRYYHLEKSLVKAGDKVKKGQVIGLVGSTGVLSIAPHLHYEVVKNEIQVDPKEYLPALPDL